LDSEEVLIVVENANHVRIAKTMLDEYAQESRQPIRPLLVYLDWTGILDDWVTDQAAKLQIEGACRNVIDVDNGSWRKRFEGASVPDALKVAEQIWFRFLVHPSGPPPRLVLFNDASLRGRAVARAAKELGIQTLLVQDGLLGCDLRNSLLSNKHWGWSRPEMAAVWGVDFARAQRLDHRQTHISSVGPTLLRNWIERHGAPADFIAREAPRQRRILVIEQPFHGGEFLSLSDSLAVWRNIATTLEGFGEMRLRLHPSHTMETRKKVVDSLPDDVDVSQEPDPFLDIANSDLVVGVSSSLLLESLAMHKQVMVFDVPELQHKFPSILSPRLVRCWLDSDPDPVASTELPPHVADDEPKVEVGTWADMMGETLGGVLAQFTSSAGGTSTLKEVGDESVANLCHAGAPPDPCVRIAALAYTYNPDLGVSHSISAAAECLASQSGRISRIDRFWLRPQPSLEFLAWLYEEYDVVVINGIRTVLLLNEAMEYLADDGDLSSRSRVYMHESPSMLESLRAEFPTAFDRYFALLRRAVPHYVVSDRLKNEMKALGFTQVESLGEAVSPHQITRLSGRRALHTRERRPHRDSSFRVVMIGTAQERKGVELFSATARFAAEHRLPFTFAWVGDTSGYAPLDQSVEWLGKLNRNQVADELLKSDIMLLSSRDDPMPLVAGEAIWAGLVVVCDEQVGTAEIVRSTGVGLTFATRSPQVVATALERAVALSIDEESWARARAKFSPVLFVERFLQGIPAYQVGVPHMKSGIVAPTSSAFDAGRSVERAANKLEQVTAHFFSQANENHDIRLELLESQNERRRMDETLRTIFASRRWRYLDWLKKRFTRKGHV